MLLADFVARRPSRDLPETSYLPGVALSPLHEWLPAAIGDRLREGLRIVDRFGENLLWLAQKLRS